VPRVSVVIPSYNHASFLNTCIDAVRAQTFTDWEIVLVDDGSKDASVDIAREIAAEEPRLQVHVNEKNLGTYGTEARGVELSSGEFIAILNSDDLWEPTKLEKQVAMLDSHPELPLCYTLGWLIDGKGRSKGEDNHLDWPREEIQEPLPFLLYENRILASSVMFRRGVAKFEPSMRYSGDWVALLRVARKGPLGCVPEYLSHWRHHGENASMRSEHQVNEEIRVRQSIIDSAPLWFVDRIPGHLIQSGLVRCTLIQAALHVLRRDMRASRAACMKAIAMKPSSRSAWRRLAVSCMPLNAARKFLWHSDPTTFKNPPPYEPIPL
jgi:glycosyltransferase involved in cell wall biosynthesis